MIRLGASTSALNRRLSLRAFSSEVKKGFWTGNFTFKPDADKEYFVANYRTPMIASMAPFGGKILMVALDRFKF